MKIILHVWLRSLLSFRMPRVFADTRKSSRVCIVPQILGSVVFATRVGCGSSFPARRTTPSRAPKSPERATGRGGASGFSASQAVRSRITIQLRNVIVALKDVPASKIPASRPRRLILDNRECKFVPHVSVLTVGSTIQSINSDPTLHNTHFYGAISANIALAFKGVKRTTGVAKPGMIIVKCDVHGWMQAFIRADSHPFFRHARDLEIEQWDQGYWLELVTAHV